MVINFQDTFDTSNALSGMYLWLIFGFLSAMINCDLQRFLQTHPAFVHFMGIIAFFFLFTIIDTGNKTSIGTVWIKTIFVYLLFVLMTKSKWFFVIPILILLLIDQSVKKDIAIKQAAEKPVSDKYLKVQKIMTLVINIIIIILIVVGVGHYIFLQYQEYGNEFSIVKFFFGVTKCKTAEQLNKVSSTNTYATPVKASVARSSLNTGKNEGLSPKY